MLVFSRRLARGEVMGRFGALRMRKGGGRKKVDMDIELIVHLYPLLSVVSKVVCLRLPIPVFSCLTHRVVCFCVYCWWYNYDAWMAASIVYPVDGLSPLIIHDTRPHEQPHLHLVQNSPHVQTIRKKIELFGMSTFCFVLQLCSSDQSTYFSR